MTDKKLFSVGNYGEDASWMELKMSHPVRGDISGKHFLRSDLALTGMEVSLNALPEKTALPHKHAHKQNEELYFFLSGVGEMEIDFEVVPVKAGTALRVATGAMRTIRSLSGGELRFIVIQAKENSLVQANLQDAILG